MISVRHRRVATVAIVLGTFASVLSSTILNVPIRDIANDLHVSIANATLLSTGYSIAFAAFLPLGGWVGNRLGRRNVYCAAVTALGLAGAIAVFAHDLHTLVIMRIIQGTASSAIVPLVMTLLADIYEEDRRALALSAWAVANSLGQALGPPLGGVLSSTFTWRSTFAPTPIIAFLTCAMALAFVPADPKRDVPLEWRGALGLTGGALLLQTAFTAIPQVGIGSPIVAGCAAGGIAALALFAHAVRTAAVPFVSPQAFREPSYVGACIAVFATTVCFGAALLTVPLYLIQGRHFSTAAAGFVAFALPLAMAVFAPWSSRAVRRYGSITASRIAMAALALGAAGASAVIAFNGGVASLTPFLLVIGVAVALNYTSTAVGPTLTEAGRYGAGIGLYNLMRIAGSAVGAATVAIVLKANAAGFWEILAVSDLVVLAGLLISASRNVR
jgi:MFS family permease